MIIAECYIDAEWKMENTRTYIELKEAVHHCVKLKSPNKRSVWHVLHSSACITNIVKSSEPERDRNFYLSKEVGLSPLLGVLKNDCFIEERHKNVNGHCEND